MAPVMAPCCLCAPTNHPGSFRCRHHRATSRRGAGDQGSCKTASQASATNPCLCAPTSHPGSFRCRLHRQKENSWEGRPLRPTSQAKCPRNPELPPPKSGDTVGVKKAAFTRTNRALSEAKLRSELNKAMVATQAVPEIVAGVEGLRLTPVEIVAKKVKLKRAPVSVTATTRTFNNDQENAAANDAASMRVPKETVLRTQFKAVKSRPSSPCRLKRRLRAKSDVPVAML